MNTTEITLKLTEIFRQVFSNHLLELTNELTSNDVNGWDSLSHMLLINEIEKSFSINFKLKDLNKMKNVGALIIIIEEKLNNK